VRVCIELHCVAGGECLLRSILLMAFPCISLSSLHGDGDVSGSFIIMHYRIVRS